MKTEFQVQNLKCGGCANTIKSRLNELEGLTNVQVDEETSTIVFDYPDDHVLGLAIAKLKSLGYPIVDDENGMLTKAKSYVSCAIGRMGS